MAWAMQCRSIGPWTQAKDGRLTSVNTYVHVRIGRDAAPLCNSFMSTTRVVEDLYNETRMGLLEDIVIGY